MDILSAIRLNKRFFLSFFFGNFYRFCVNFWTHWTIIETKRNVVVGEKHALESLLLEMFEVYWLISFLFFVWCMEMWTYRWPINEKRTQFMTIVESVCVLKSIYCDACLCIKPSKLPEFISLVFYKRAWMDRMDVLRKHWCINYSYYLNLKQQNNEIKSIQ